MDNIVAFGRLISDPTRLKIMKLLLTQPMCVCELMEVLRLNQPCVSQHLTILKYHHLLKARRQAKWIVYRIDQRRLNQDISEIGQFVKKQLSRIAVLKKEFRRLSHLKHRGLLCQKLKCNR